MIKKLLNLYIMEQSYNDFLAQDPGLVKHLDTFSQSLVCLANQNHLLSACGFLW